MLFSHELLTALLRATVFTSVAVALVWLLNSRLRTASPSFQRAAWAIALAQSWLLFPWTLRIEMASAPEPIATTHVATIMANESMPIQPVQIVYPLDEAAMSADIFTWANLAAAMLAAWGGGAIVLVLSRAARYVRFVRQLPAASHPSSDDEPWQAEWQQQLAAARIRRCVEMRMTSDTGPLVCFVPFLYLILAPRVLWQSLSGNEREAILQHELAHLSRGDIWKSLAIRLLALPQWFNPLVWRAVRSFDEAGEWACDDRVARAGRGSQLQLAKSLVRAAEFVTASVPAAASAQGGVLSRRIRRLVTPQIQEESKMKKIMLVLLLVALAAVQSVRIERVAAAPQIAAPPPAYEEKLLGIEQPWSPRLGPYVIEPPDLVRLSVGQLPPKPDYKISISDAMHVIGLEESNGIPVVHTFEVNSKGDVELGAEYGAVQVVGRTQADAQTAIAERVNSRRPESERRRVTASVNYPIGAQRIFAGEKLVGPDGKIHLGKYGTIYISGKTVLGARNAIQTHLEQFFVEPQINLDVTSYNSKKFYVVTEGFAENVISLPATGNETVHDAISNVAMRPPSARVWVARPAANGEADRIMPVNWVDIRSGNSTATNYQVLPGDRVYISTKPNAPAGSNDAADEKRPSSLDRYTYPPDGKNDPTADPRGVMIHLKGGPGNGVQMMLGTPEKDATLTSVIASIKTWPHPVMLDRATITVRRYDADGIEQKLPVVWDSAKDRPSSETNHAIRPSDQIEILERSLPSPSVARLSNPPVPADRPQAIVHAALPAGAPLPPPPPAIVATDQGDGKILPIQLVAAENGATVVTAMAQVKRWLVAKALAKSPTVLQRRNQDGAVTKELPIVWDAKTHEPTPDSNYTLEPGDMILIGNPRPTSADDSADGPIKPTVKYPPPYDRPVIVQLKSGNGKPHNAAELVPLEGETVSGMLDRIKVWPNPVAFATSGISVLRTDDDGVLRMHGVTWDAATRKPTPETDHALRPGDAIVIVEGTRSAPAPAPGGMYAPRALANARPLSNPPSATAVPAGAAQAQPPASLPDPTEGKTFVQYRAVIFQDTSDSMAAFKTEKDSPMPLAATADTATIDATLRILMNNKLIAFMSRPRFIVIAGEPHKLSISHQRAVGQIDEIEMELEVAEANDRISTRVHCKVVESGRTAIVETVVSNLDGESVIREFARPALPPGADADDKKRFAATPIYLVLTPEKIRRAPADAPAK